MTVRAWAALELKEARHLYGPAEGHLAIPLPPQIKYS